MDDDDLDQMFVDMKIDANAQARFKERREKIVPEEASSKDEAAEEVEVAPFDGLLAWVRTAHVGESDATAIEQAHGDTTEVLRAQLKKALARIGELESAAGS